MDEPDSGDDAGQGSDVTEDSGIPPSGHPPADAGHTTQNPDAGMSNDVDAGMPNDVDAGMPNDVDAGMPNDVDAGMPNDVDTGMMMPPGPLPPDIDTGSPVYYFETWKSATGFCQPTPQTDSTSCGQLLAGRNYFYCQKRTADTWQEGEYLNDWWLYTDLDTPKGAHGWVSAVYVTVGGNYERIPGLPDCLF